MNLIKKKEKQSSQIHEEIRKATFISEKTKKITRFKYEKLYKPILDSAKFITLLIKPFNWKQIIKDCAIWIIEAFIDGILINFATWALLGDSLTVAKILAYGIVMKKVIEFMALLKKDGEYSEVHTPDKRSVR